MAKMLLLLTLPVSLLGCARVDRQLGRLGLTPRTETVGATVDTDQGPLTVYRYTEQRPLREDLCGEGFRIGGADAGGAMPCSRTGALTMMAQTYGSQSILIGQVNDTRIARVVLALNDGQKLNATVAKGVWYALVPGGDKLPPVIKVDGLDQADQVVFSLPVAPPDAH